MQENPRSKIIVIAVLIGIVMFGLLILGVTTRTQTNNTKSTQEKERAGGTSYQEKDAAVRAKSSIVDKLPALGLYFRIDYGKSLVSPDSNDSVALLIKAPDPQARQEALTWIRSQGYDPSDLEIIFRDLQSGD